MATTKIWDVSAHVSIEKTVERIEFPQAVQQAREANKKDTRGDR